MKRSGFSLIEVILATAILLASAFVLSELAGIGRRQAQRATLESKAQELCERTLLEVLQGERPLLPVQSEPLAPLGIDLEEFQPEEDLPTEDELLIFDDPDEQSLIKSMALDLQSEWVYSLRVTPMEQQPGLAEVLVTVKQADSQIPRPVSFRLRRWVAYSGTSEADNSISPPGFGFTPGAAR